MPKVSINILLAIIFSMVYFSFIPIEKISDDKKTWSVDELNKANTAEQCSYMTENEKLTVQYCNLVRLFPDKFSSLEVLPYIEEHSMQKNQFVISLIADLKKQKSLPALLPDSVLYEKAKQFAILSGEKGQVGHYNFANRMKGYLLAGENCDYGSSKPLEIIMHLLIDDGVTNLGHRKNILNQEFIYVGVSIQKHKRYNYMCVMDFIGKKHEIETNNSKSHYKKKKKSSYFKF